MTARKPRQATPPEAPKELTPLTETTLIVRRDEAFPLDQLAPYYKNPRRGNMKVIRESLRRFGQYRSICVNIGTKTGRPNEILGGNHTARGMADEGFTTAVVDFVDVDEDEAKRIVLMDNAAADKAKNDGDVLKDLLVSLDDIAGTGYTLEEVAKITAADSAGTGTDESDLLGEQRWAVIVDLTDETEQIELLEELLDRGLSAKPMVM